MNFDVGSFHFYASVDIVIIVAKSPCCPYYMTEIKFLDPLLGNIWIDA